MLKELQPFPTPIAIVLSIITLDKYWIEAEMYKCIILIMKKKNIFVALLIVIVLAGAVLYQKGGSKTKAKGHVNASIGPEPATIDPAKNIDAYGAVYLQHMFEGLAKLDSNNQLVPGMAQSWDVSTDGLTYIFHLKEGAVWSDGKSLTAEDFAYAWKRVLAPETASLYVDRLYFIKNAEKYNKGLVKADDVGVKALDSKTLQVTLEKPTPFFVSLTILNPYFPVRKDIIDQKGDTWTQDPATYISNGPYVLVAWNHNSSIEMKKNIYYYDAPKMKINTISWKLTSDDTSALNAFETGELDFNAGFINTNELPRLTSENKVRKVAALGVSYIIFNMQRAPFENPKIRQALSLAIDRKELAENVLRDGSVRATGFIPFGLPSIGAGSDFRTDPEAKIYFSENADLEGAKKILAEAGYPEGKGLREFEYYTSKNSTNQKIAEYVQNQWAKIGVNIKINLLESKVFSEYRSQGKYDITKGSWGGDYYDPYTFLSAFLSDSPNNYGRWKNNDYDTYVNLSISSPDKNSQISNAHKAEDVLIGDLPIIPLSFLSQNALVNPKLKGIYMNSLYMMMFTNAYWEN